MAILHSPCFPCDASAWKIPRQNAKILQLRSKVLAACMAPPTRSNCPKVGPTLYISQDIKNRILPAAFLMESWCGSLLSLNRLPLPHNRGGHSQFLQYGLKYFCSWKCPVPRHCREVVVLRFTVQFTLPWGCTAQVIAGPSAMACGNFNRILQSGNLFEL